MQARPSDPGQAGRRRPKIILLTVENVQAQNVIEAQGTRGSLNEAQMEVGIGALNTLLERVEDERPFFLARWFAGDAEGFMEPTPFSHILSDEEILMVFAHAVTNYNQANGLLQNSDREGYDFERGEVVSTTETPIVESGQDALVNDLNLAVSTDDTPCLDRWIAAHRNEVGDEALITNDQLHEWHGWCKDGRVP